MSQPEIFLSLFCSLKIPHCWWDFLYSALVSLCDKKCKGNACKKNAGTLLALSQFYVEHSKSRCMRSASQTGLSWRDLTSVSCEREVGDRPAPLRPTANPPVPDFRAVTQITTRRRSRFIMLPVSRPIQQRPARNLISLKRQQAEGRH